MGKTDSRHFTSIISSFKMLGLKLATLSLFLLTSCSSTPIQQLSERIVSIQNSPFNPSDCSSLLELAKLIPSGLNVCFFIFNFSHLNYSVK